jgi:hypothetical protein
LIISFEARAMELARLVTIHMKILAFMFKKMASNLRKSQPCACMAGDTK